MRYLLITMLAGALALLAGCGGGQKQGGEQAAPAGSVQENGGAASDTSARAAGAGEESAKMSPIVERSMKKDPGPADEVAVLKTNMGTVTLRFFPEQAPLAVANFKGLAAKGYYNGVTFHRVIKGFMIQAGDPTGTGAGGESLWGGTFKTENAPGLRFDHAGVLGMARKPTPDTNSSQFFITVAPQPSLDGKYTVFGEVETGMDVVNAIAAVPTDSHDRPQSPVTIESVTIETENK